MGSYVEKKLQEQKLKDKMLVTKQKRIENLIESLDDQTDIQELDSKTIDELKATLDTLIQSRKNVPF